MLKMIEQKQLGFSNFIDEESQQFIINNIDTKLVLYMLFLIQIMNIQNLI
jgi:hypothetical protein